MLQFIILVLSVELGCWIPIVSGILHSTSKNLPDSGIWIPLQRAIHKYCLLPVSSRIEFKIMLIAYKVLNDRAPIYLQQLLQLYAPSRNLRSSNRNLLVKPYFNLNSYGKRAFSVAAPELWNKLPEDIKSANSVDAFKRKLKTFLFM